ncbi:DNRLRE domain-containing protein [Echinicola soli]|uniref:DNRLRE domain-containing protein n=1 Tax=Echinicola soli TaxID=2591634 RepID=A0A514CKW3_9BACT|nr:polysaccharide lyase family 8 super-sandwich domain-containing protein [Echinicola soli]QDH80466.1 DNRLRE domain-containing protein [Echinicola soli]
MMKVLLKPLIAIVFLFLIGLSGLVHAQSDPETSEIDIIQERFYQGFISSPSVESNDQNVTNLMASQEGDGSWSDIDYQSNAQSIWPPGDHLYRLEIYARSYSNPASDYYNSADLLSRIETTITYWLNLDPEPSSTNWFFYAISVPKDIGNTLIALREAPNGISTAMENDLLDWMTKSNRPFSDFTESGGPNLTDVAQHYMMRACITNDEHLLSETVEAVSASIKIDPESGIQPDNSFKAHGPQLYTYGYGTEFIKGIGVIGNSVVGTSFAFPVGKMAIFSDFMRKGFMKPVRGQYVDFNNFGRGISRPNNARAQPSIIAPISQIDLPEHKSEYEDAIARMKGEKDASYNIVPEHYHYWTTDYSLHIRPEYTFGLRSVSRRTAKSEAGNGENEKGHFLAEGVTYIGVSGDEYYNIYPTWDWNKIPGTTTPEITSYPKRPQWGGNLGTSSFVGGVSDGVYGVSAYAMDDYGTRAKKSWFFFDDEIVCLGSGIEATAAEAINTTVNQSHLTTDVNVSTTGGTSVLSSGMRSYNGDLKWVTQGNVGYLFPSGGNISLSNQTQTGTWKSINTSQSDAEVSHEVFKLWFNHGVAPQDASYSYVVLPGKGTPTAMQGYDQSRIDILVNSDSVQAVLHRTLNILQVVFYKAATLKYGDVLLKADRACTVMLTDPGSAEVAASVADPAQTHSELNLVYKNGVLGEPRTLTMTLPSGDYAGSTVSGKINSTLPVYVPPAPPIMSLVAIADSYVRDGSHSSKNYGTETGLVVKDNPSSYLRESLLKFDLSALPAQTDSVVLRLYVKETNADIEKGVKWKFYKVPNDWSETSVSYDDKPAATGDPIGEVRGSSAGTYVKLNVSGALQDHSTDQLSLLVVADLSSFSSGGNSSWTDATFASRESTEEGIRPQLLVYGDAPEEAVTGSVVAEADAFVDKDNPDNNYGSNGYMAAQQDRRDIFLRFDISDVDPDKVTSAKMRVFFKNDETSVGLNLHPVADNTWEETGITWNNAPAGGDVIATVSGESKAKQEAAAFDITSQLQNYQSDGEPGYITFKISSASGSGVYLDFYTRNSPETEYHPKLVYEEGGTTASTSEIDIIQERIYQGFISSPSVESNDQNVANLMASQEEDGSWSDIDYQSNAQSIWPPGNHFSRLEVYARSYSNPASDYYNSPELLSTIETTITYWLELDPEPSSTNWFFYTIGVPKDIGNTLIALREAPNGISTAMENDLIAVMTKGHPITHGYITGSASNTTDVAQHQIMRACLTDNAALLSEAVDAVTAWIKIDVEAGIQPDNSFKAHGPQLYTYGYGTEFIKGIGVIGNSVVGTSFAFPAGKMAIFSDFMRKGFMEPVRGRYVDFNVFGRGISRPNNARAQPNIIAPISQIDLPEHKSEYEDAIARMKGEKDASYNIVPEHYHYWTTDYSLHIRPEYTFGLRSVSRRTAKSESGNGENIKGNFMTEGVTYIGVSGDEYYNIYPTWDWNKIPGTTTPEITSFPSRTSWGSNLGTSSFVGGVSDGVYGVSAYAMDDYGTRAKKSWFFFDDEIVCLGSGIEATAAEAINTTVNQSHLTTDVNVSTTGGASVLSSGIRSYNGDLKWVTQGNVGYLFPSGGNINLSNQTQTGTWKSINTNQSDAEVSHEVFKLWFNHGVAPQDASYSYVVLPGKGTPAAMQSYDQSRIDILVNSDSVQAVLHRTLNILQVVFYKAATLKYGDVLLKADRACTVMLTDPGSAEVAASVADPAQTHSELNLVYKNGVLGEPRTLTMTLPSGDYAGSTVSGKINSALPVYVPPAPPVMSLVAIEDSYVRDGVHSSKNFGTETGLVVKDNPSSYLRESLLKFDLSGLPVQTDSVVLRLYVKGANTDIEKGVRWKFYKVADDWGETTVTYDNRPAATGDPIGEVWGSSAGTYVTLNVSGALQDHGTGQLSLLVAADLSSFSSGGNTGWTDATFASRESTAEETRPQLLVYGDAPEEAVTGSVVAEADAFVDKNNPDTNYGSNSYMAAQQDRRDIFLRFDISDIDPDKVTSAKMLVFFQNDETSVGLNLHPVADNTWGETGITWNNAPAGGGVIATVSGESKAKQEAAAFDITSQLQNYQSDGEPGYITFKISSVSWAYLDFYTINSPETEYRPKIVYEEGDPSGTTASNSEIDIIEERFYQKFLSSESVGSNDQKVVVLSDSQNADGSWPDIDYQSQDNVIWPPGRHFKMLEVYVRSYTNPESAYYRSAELLQRIETTITYWVELNPEPESVNWYHGTIGLPKRIGQILIALRQVPETIPVMLENELLAWMTKGLPITHQYMVGSASNTSDVAQHQIMRACLTDDPVLLSETVDVVTAWIKIDIKAGIQPDYSFKAHGSQLYIYGYGSEFIKGIGLIGSVISGTSYAFSAEKMAILSNFVRKGFIKPLRGGFADLNNFGRGITRPNNGKAPKSLIGTISVIDLPEHKSEYDDAIARMTGEKEPSYNLSPEHTHYWTTDYSLHLRPEYTFGLRLVSNRTIKSEGSSTENLKGHFLAEGVTYIAVDGDEYYNIYPTWDWNKIPGTTTPEITSFPTRPSWWNDKGVASFVGGVSDGVYGVSAYAMDDYGTRAKKSWFFFDDEIVCLGSGIEATAAEAINTTVNQSHLTTDVNVSTTGGASVLSSGIRSYNGDLKWVTQGNVGYLFPSGGNINLSNQTQTGTWKSINTNQSDAEVSHEVFKLWFNHGVAPQDASYSYVVLPGKGTPAAMQSYDQSRIDILVNSDSVQAVLHRTLNILQVVFYKAATLKYGDVLLKADRACTVMLTDPGSAEVAASVADPAQTHSELNLVYKNGVLGEPRTLTMTLPSGDYAGSTVSGKINSTLPVYVPPAPPIMSLVAIADSYVRDGSHSSKNYGTETGLVVKDNPSSYLRESLLKFDLSALPVQTDSVVLRLYVKETNADIEKGVKWKFYKVADDWGETTVTYDNRPAATGDPIGEVRGSSAGTYVKLNVSGALQDHGTDQLSLLVVADLSSFSSGGNSSWTDATFGSRESTEEGIRPQLLVYGELPLAITGHSQTNVSCSGGADGSATISVDGGSGNYTYLWSPSGGTGVKATGLAAGEYTVTVTDSNGLTVTQSFEITQAETSMHVHPTQNNVSCNGGSDGSATVSVTGGSEDYTYSWSTGGSDATATELTAGTYTVTVTDGFGCTVTKSFEITEPEALVATLSAQNSVSCNGGSDGLATVSVTGGSGDYTYSWSTGGSDATATGLTAGTYTVTVTDGNNCTVTKPVEITEAETSMHVHPTQNNVSCNGGSDGSATVSVTGGSEDYTYSWSTGGSGATATELTAGTYTVTVTDGFGCAVTQSFEITEPDPIVFHGKRLSNGKAGRTYDETVSASGSQGEFTYSIQSGKLPVGLNLSSTGHISGIPEEAGDFIIEISVADKCSSEHASFSIEIAKQNQSLTFKPFPSGVMYGEGSINVDAGASSGLKVKYTSSNPSVAVINGQQVDIVGAGTATITAVQEGNDEFESASKDQELTVGLRSINVTVDRKHKTYGEPDPVLTYTATGFANGEDESILRGSLDRVSGEGTGTYAIRQGTLSVGSNYTINFEGADFSISPAALKVKADSHSKIYGEGDPVFTVGYEGFVNGEDKTVLGGSLSVKRAAGEDAGSYAVTPSGYTAKNYTIDYADGNLEIVPAALKVKADSHSKIYGEGDPMFTVGYEGFVNGEDKAVLGGSLSVKRADGEDAGSYAVIPSGYTAENYTIDYADGNLEIVPAALKVKADSHSKIYGEGDPMFTVGYEGFVNGEDKTVLGGSLSVKRADGEDAGSYAVIPSGYTAENYTIDYADGNLEIVPAALKVKADSHSKIYGEGDPMFTVGYEGFVNGEDKTVLGGSLSVKRADGEDAGSYAVTPSGYTAENYTIDYADGNLEIVPAALKVKADSHSKIYGEGDPMFTVGYEGFVNGEDKTVLGGNLSVKRAAGEDAGSYAVTPSGYTAENYTIDYADGNLEIVPAALKVKADSHSKIYGEGDPMLTYKAMGFTNHDDSAVLTGELSRTAGDDLGSYPINIGTLSAGDNYAIQFEGALFTIEPVQIEEIFTPAPVEVAWGVSPGEVNLPENVLIRTRHDEMINLAVIWDKGPINLRSRGTYQITGELVLPKSIDDNTPEPYMDVTVLAKPVPTDITLDHDQFEASVDHTPIAVGACTVIDPVDSQHTLGLVPKAADNRYFSLSGTTLYWDSEETVAGKTSFDLLLQVTDADGNIMEKTFTVTRLRKPLNEVVIYNSFTPDNNGSNDSWGVSELQLYTEVRFMIFERSGKRVFYTEDPKKRWDGTYNGNKMPSGTYFWVIEVKETGEVRKGTLNLLR